MTETTTSGVNSVSTDELPKLAFTADEVGVMLGISTPRVRRLIQRGKLRARNTGGERGNVGAYIISKAAVLEYLNGRDEPLASAS